MPCPRCGNDCHCSGSVSVLIDPEGFDNSEQRFDASLYDASGVARRATVAAQSLVSAGQPVREWRNELASRVRAHRTRRYGAASSMPLNFDAELQAEPAALHDETLVESEQANGVEILAASELSPTNHEEETSQPPAAGFYRRVITRCAEEEPKVIEFPRSPEVEESIRQELISEELAEPLLPAPRILDVPEPVMTLAPQLDAVHLDEHVEEPEWRSPSPSEFELPPNAAPLRSRGLAALFDSVLVLFAFGVFFTIALSMGHITLQGKNAVLVLVGTPLLLWAAYQYAFLVYSGLTPGMEFARLELADFEGAPPRRCIRAARAGSLLISCMSLGMGFAWSFIDPDGLGWHDRISRTYLREG